MFNRAILLERDGRLTEAEDMQRRCLQLRQRVLGQDHHQVRNELIQHSFATMFTHRLQTLQSAVALASLLASGGEVEEGACSVMWPRDMVLLRSCGRLQPFKAHVQRWKSLRR
jgi:hypothetical protein